MKKIYSVDCNKYRNFLNPKIPYIFGKALGICIIWSKCGNNRDMILKEEEIVDILKIFDLINNMTGKS